MPDLLTRMGFASAARLAVARQRIPEPAMRRLALDSPVPPPLQLSSDGFDLIAEFKPRSPADGWLVDFGQDSSESNPHSALIERVLGYRRGGAAAISVLTEPRQFGGSLSALTTVAKAVAVPVMRKDFLIDSYQVFEARAAGAGGVLVIVRLLTDAGLEAMVAAALEAQLFVLLEAFNEEDLSKARRFVESATPSGEALRRESRLLLGVNARDLSSLEIDQTRFDRLGDRFPAGVPRVAESGLRDPEAVAQSAGLGYHLALVGTALMRSTDPESAVAEMIAAGRAKRRVECG